MKHAPVVQRLCSYGGAFVLRSSKVEPLCFQANRNALALRLFCCSRAKIMQSFPFMLTESNSCTSPLFLILAFSQLTACHGEHSSKQSTAVSILMNGWKRTKFCSFPASLIYLKILRQSVHQTGHQLKWRYCDTDESPALTSRSVCWQLSCSVHCRFQPQNLNVSARQKS